MDGPACECLADTLGQDGTDAPELGTSIDASPPTLHQVTTALRFGLAEHQFDFRAGDVLVIEETAMSGTHTLHAVVRYALSCGADVRLIGGDKQLAVRFQQVVRFTDPGQAAASLQIRAGNRAGLRYYLDNNWGSDLRQHPPGADQAHKVAIRSQGAEGGYTLALTAPANKWPG